MVTYVSTTCSIMTQLHKTKTCMYHYTHMHWDLREWSLNVTWHKVGVPIFKIIILKIILN
jgi:hypothetical protein